MVEENELLEIGAEDNCIVCNLSLKTSSVEVRMRSSMDVSRGVEYMVIPEEKWGSWKCGIVEASKSVE